LILQDASWLGSNIWFKSINLYYVKKAYPSGFSAHGITYPKVSQLITIPLIKIFKSKTNKNKTTKQNNKNKTTTKFNNNKSKPINPILPG